jgi:hypothetical protein
MELDCHRHGGYVIWLGRATGAGWSYPITPTAAPLGPSDAPRGEDDVGSAFRTKTLALTRARERIRQTSVQESHQRSGGYLASPDTTRRRTP